MLYRYLQNSSIKNNFLAKAEDYIKTNNSYKYKLKNRQYSTTKI